MAQAKAGAICFNLPIGLQTSFRQGKENDRQHIKYISTLQKAETEINQDLLSFLSSKQYEHPADLP